MLSASIVEPPVQQQDVSPTHQQPHTSICRSATAA